MEALQPDRLTAGSSMTRSCKVWLIRLSLPQEAFTMGTCYIITGSCSVNKKILPEDGREKWSSWCVFFLPTLKCNTVSMHNKPKEIRLFITENPSHFSLLSLSNLVNHSLNSALNLGYVLNAGSNLWVAFLCSLTKIWTSAKDTKECFLHYKSQL